MGGKIAKCLGPRIHSLQLIAQEMGKKRGKSLFKAWDSLDNFPVERAGSKANVASTFRVEEGGVTPTPALHTTESAADDG